MCFCSIGTLFIKIEHMRRNHVVLGLRPLRSSRWVYVDHYELLRSSLAPLATTEAGRQQQVPWHRGPDHVQVARLLLDADLATRVESRSQLYR